MYQCIQKRLELTLVLLGEILQPQRELYVASPTPATFENTARFTPHAIAALTIPPNISFIPKALEKIKANILGISVTFAINTIHVTITYPIAINGTSICETPAILFTPPKMILC